MSGTSLENDNYVYPGKRFAQNGFVLGEGQGISLRDHFAGQAMAAMLADEALTERQVREIGPASYLIADAMLKARTS